MPERRQRWLQFLPDGQRFLFQDRIGDDEQPGIYLGALDGSPPVRLTDAAAAGAYVPDGWVLWEKDPRQRLDSAAAARLEIDAATAPEEASGPTPALARRRRPQGGLDT